MKLKRYIAAITGLLFAACTANQAQPAKTVDNKSLLWRIEKKGMKPSYLFGTIHMLCPDDYVWTDVMKRSLEKTDEVCFEMDMDDPNLMMQVAAGMIDQSGKTLEDYFTPEQYKQLQQYVKDSLGADISMFRQMKPMALQTLFATKSVGCAMPVSYEANIMEEAKKQKKEIVGLEPASEQLALFDSLPADTVVKEIMASVTHPETDNGEFASILAAYKQQDLPKLYELIKNNKDFGDDMGAFLDQRNQKWIGRMGDKMKDHSIFFAVGAGHLWGDQGVITLLRKAGYTVVAVK
jgi:uncharacterized protein YbaP (TraB family)